MAMGGQSVILLPLPDGSYKAFVPADVVMSGVSASVASSMSGTSAANPSAPSIM